MARRGCDAINAYLQECEHGLTQLQALHKYTHKAYVKWCDKQEQQDNLMMRTVQDSISTASKQQGLMEWITVSAVASALRSVRE